jgi:hypothetical protein
VTPLLLLIPPHSSSLLLTPPHSSSLLLIPPHSSSFLLTPPPHSSSTKSGSNGPYIVTNVLLYFIPIFIDNINKIAYFNTIFQSLSEKIGLK